MNNRSIEKIPTWSITYLLYGDSTSLTDEEIKLCDNFMRNVEIVSPIDGEPYFSPSPTSDFQQTS